MSSLVSVVTVVLNRASTIQECLESVRTQTYSNREHIVIDGVSTDGTLEILEKSRYQLGKLVSERDRGLYDAMNKGARMSSGEVVGFLNSDDLYASDRVLENIMREFENSDVDAVYGDLVYVKADDTTHIVRDWRTGAYSAGKMWWGWHIPHPSFYVRRSFFERAGGFDIRLRIAADYELMLKLIRVHKIRMKYLPETFVRMRVGGESNKSLKAIVRGNRESLQAWRQNGLLWNPLLPFTKPLSKVAQLRL